MVTTTKPTGHNATCTSETLAAPALFTRESLSFTRCEPNGILNNWAVSHMPKDNWEHTVPRSRAFFAEVVELARQDQEEARQAILFALNGATIDVRRADL